MIEVVLFALLGVGAGAFTGVVPGIHPNTLALGILSASSVLIGMFGVQGLTAFLVAAAVSHTFLSFIPSVFLGAPETGTALSVLPGHRLLLQGRGREAVCLTVAGGIGVMVLGVAALPVLFWFIPAAYGLMKVYMPWVLLGVMGVMVASERRRLPAVLVLGMSGLLGLFVLDLSVMPSSVALFPLLTGLFGTSTLLISIVSGMRVPEQLERAGLEFRTVLWGSVKGFFSGLFVGLLPGIGAAQAGVLVQEATRRRNEKEFLVALGGINTVAAVFSLLALYFISKPRSGVAVAVSELTSSLGFMDMLLLVSVALLAAGLAGILTIKMTGWFSGFVRRVDYQKLSWGVTVFLVILTAVMSGPFGLLVLFTATAIGLSAPLMNVRRSHCMGCLMIPVVYWLIIAV